MCRRGLQPDRRGLGSCLHARKNSRARLYGRNLATRRMESNWAVLQCGAPASSVSPFTAGLNDSASFSCLGLHSPGDPVNPQNPDRKRAISAPPCAWTWDSGTPAFGFLPHSRRHYVGAGTQFPGRAPGGDVPAVSPETRLPDLHVPHSPSVPSPS